MLRPRTRAALARARDAGAPCRRRHRPDVPRRCGRTSNRRASTNRSSATRARSSPTRQRRVAPSRADPARARPRGDDAVLERRGYPLNCYVDDELYVAEITPEAGATPSSSTSPIHAVGDRCATGSTAPDEARSRRRSRRARRARGGAQAAVRRRLYISKSLPYFLEFAQPGRQQGQRPRVRRRAARLRARRRRSRAATARTTASSSSGPASGRRRERAPRRARAADSSSRRSRRKAWPLCSRRT